MIVRIQPVPLGVDHKEGEILDVANLVFGIDAQFANRIEATRTRGRGRLETENFVVCVLMAPTGSELVQLAFKIRDKYAFSPGE